VARKATRAVASTKSWRPLPAAALSSTHPAAVAFGEAGDGTVGCPICGRQFLVASNLAAHQAEDH
jgi:hypothetical protein